MIWIVHKFFAEFAGAWPARLLFLILFSPLTLQATAPPKAIEMKVVKVISSDAALRALSNPGGQVKISFQESFQRNRVALQLNGTKAFEGLLTTDPVSGLAQSIVHPIQASRINFYLDIDGKAYRATVWIKNGPYLAVERKNGNVRVLQSTQPFAYERQN